MTKGERNMKKGKIKVTTISPLEATLSTKERFNPYACGYGSFKNEKHPSRAREKSRLRKELAW